MDLVLTLEQLIAAGVLIFLAGCVAGALISEPKEKPGGHFY